MEKSMSENFSASYKKLNEIAQKLRTQAEPDIDALVPMVEEATKAYQQCKKRIDAVKLALDEHLRDPVAGS